MNDHNGFWLAEKRGDSVRKVVQCVLVLGENDEFPTVAVSIEHLRLVLKKGRELIPFAIGSGLSNTEGQSFQASKDVNLGLEFCDSAGCRRRIHHLLLDLFDLSTGQVVQVFEVIFSVLGYVIAPIKSEVGCSFH